jgi:hypothetical protein
MAEKVEILRREYRDVPAIRTLCDALTATADGVHGRALENQRSDDKRVAAVVAAD